MGTNPGSERGFTLIELAFVLTIIAALAAVTVPAYEIVLRRAEAAEADAMLHGIAQAQLRYWRDHGEYLACPAEGPIPIEPVAFDADRPCWKALGVQADGPVRYRYGVDLADGSYTVVAEGDLDGDGYTSRFEVSGRTLRVTLTHGSE